MITVLASIKVKLEEKDKFLEIFNKNIPNVLKEDGCIEYAPMVDAHSGVSIQEKDKSIVTIVEKWKSPEALHAHLKAPHMAAYQKEVSDIVENVSLKVLKKA